MGNGPQRIRCGITQIPSTESEWTQRRECSQKLHSHGVLEDAREDAEEAQDQQPASLRGEDGGDDLGACERRRDREVNRIR